MTSQPVYRVHARTLFSVVTFATLLTSPDSFNEEMTECCGLGSNWCAYCHLLQVDTLKARAKAAREYSSLVEKRNAERLRNKTSCSPAKQATAQDELCRQVSFRDLRTEDSGKLPQAQVQECIGSQGCCLELLSLAGANLSLKGT